MKRRSDSRTIVFIQAGEYKDGPVMGELASLKVRGDDGLPLARLPIAQQLVHVIASPSTQIASLTDGSILFSSRNVQLPATFGDFSDLENVYAFKPGDQMARRLMTRLDAQRLKTITSIAVNPSESSVVVGGSEAGWIDVVNIKTGKADSFHTQTKFDPCWRNADELCFTQPLQKKAANEHEAEVVLHNCSTNTDRIVSGTWPKSAVTGFLISNK